MMALTTLDPITALVVVDLQAGLVGAPFIHPFEDVVAHTCALINAFRRCGLPIVLVNVDGTAPGRTERPRHNGQFPDGWTDLIPGLDRQPGDIVVTKRTWGAFANTDLEKQLRAIISILFLLILMISRTLAYIYFNQDESDINQYDSSGKTINDEDVENEIDDMFIDENDELEIGEII